MKKKSIKKLFKLALLIIIGGFLYNIVYFDIPLEDIKAKYTNNASKFIVIDSTNVHYRDEGKGIPIVLIHGTAASLHTWDSWTQELKKNYRVIRMDLPAFGLTGPNTTHDYSMKNYTSFIDQFLNELDIDSLYLAGNSLGGNIAWNYAADYPNKVKKLILIDPSGYPFKGSMPFLFNLAKTPIINQLIKYITPKTLIKKNLKQVYFNDTKITDELVTRYHELTLREGNRQAFINRVKAMNYNNSEKLKNITASTLILWGENDVWIPKSFGEKFHEKIHNSKLVILPNTGHAPMEENPILSLKPTLNFLNKN